MISNQSYDDARVSIMSEVFWVLYIVQKKHKMYKNKTRRVANNINGFFKSKRVLKGQGNSTQSP